MNLPRRLNLIGILFPPQLRYENQNAQGDLFDPNDRSFAYHDEPVAANPITDPLRQSDFYAQGNKIHPCAQMPFVSKLNIPWLTGFDLQSFGVGKSYHAQPHPMYAGSQSPLSDRVNIDPGIPTTYGSIYTFGPSGQNSDDGYPY